MSRTFIYVYGICYTDVPRSGCTKVVIRVRTTTSDGKEYVSVVRDETKEGSRSMETLRSFGRKDPESIARAYQFKASCEALRELAREEKTREPSAVNAVFGHILGWENVKKIVKASTQGTETPGESAELLKP